MNDAQRLQYLPNVSEIQNVDWNSQDRVYHRDNFPVLRDRHRVPIAVGLHSYKM